MFCKKCGTKIEDDSKFCSNCGQRIDEEKVVQQSEQIEEVKIAADKCTECDEYEQLYAQAELGTKPYLWNRIRDGIFSKVTRIRTIRVTGTQLALIFKKYFVDTCNSIEEVEELNIVLKLNVGGRKFRKDDAVCYNKGKYRWIKDCERKKLWELQEGLFGNEYYKYVNSVKKILEEKKCELQGIPYDSSSFVPIKMKGKVPLVIATVLVWAFVIWGYATNWGEDLGSSSDETVSSFAGDQNEINEEEQTQSFGEENQDTGESFDAMDEDADGEKSLGDEIFETHDYILEADDGQMEVVLEYTLSRGGYCEFYINYYDEDGNVVNDEYSGIFSEGREGEGVLDLEGASETISYYYDYSTNPVSLVLITDYGEFYLTEMY